MLSLFGNETDVPDCTMLTRGTARSHAELAVDISHSNLALQALPPGLGVDSPVGLALLNNEVTRQAAMMSYVHVFEAMMVMTVLAMPLLLLIRKPARADNTAAMADAPH